MKLLAWIEDPFVCWYAVDVPYLESPHPMAPVVMEQYRCYKPVDCCNAWLFETLLAADQATGKEIYLQKSKSLAAALTHARRANGSMATWCFYNDPDKPENHSDWFNCMAYDAHMLMRYESVLR